MFFLFTVYNWKAAHRNLPRQSEFRLDLRGGRFSRHRAGVGVLLSPIVLLWCRVHQNLYGNIWFSAGHQTCGKYSDAWERNCRSHYWFAGGKRQREGFGYVDMTILCLPRFGVAITKNLMKPGYAIPRCNRE